MDSDKLKRLREAGVWPEGFYFEPHTCGYAYARGQHVESLPERFARSALIDAMMDALPDDWTFTPNPSGTWSSVCDENGDRIASNKDRFLALFDALVSAGVVQ